MVLHLVEMGELDCSVDSEEDSSQLSVYDKAVDIDTDID